MENENACGYKDLSYKIEEERLIMTSLFSEFWPNYFVKENVTTSFFQFFLFLFIHIHMYSLSNDINTYKREIKSIKSGTHKNNLQI